jgi:hypothetical protein
MKWARVDEWKGVTFSPSELGELGPIFDLACMHDTDLDTSSLPICGTFDLHM